MYDLQGLGTLFKRVVCGTKQRDLLRLIQF